MNGNYILDSNIIIDIFRGELATIKAIAQLEKIYVPSIVLGELFYGANKSSQFSKKKVEINQLKERVDLLAVTDNTAEYYGSIKNSLRKKGKPIPENDIWIAAIAKENNLPIITNDKHFLEIEGIVVEAIN